MAEQTVLDRLKEAFPSEYIGESPTDHRFRFAPRAMIWVRKSDLNIARIWIAQKKRDDPEWRCYLQMYPNSDELRRVIDNPAVDVRRHTTQTKVECLFGPHNVGRLIEALNGRMTKA